MANSPNLILPYIEAAQAQKHVTHNEAVRALDALVFLLVQDKDLNTPPGTPLDGQRWIVAASPTGAWVGQTGKIAAWQDGAWTFFAPKEGFLAWLADEDKIYSHSGSAWGNLAGAAVDLSNVPLLGVNTTADATNKLAVASAAILFNHASAGVQVKLNKSAAGQSAALLFQDAFSGRAEVGLTGDDDFHVKVSPDGSSFKDAIRIDRASAAVSLDHGRVNRRGTGFILESYDPADIDPAGAALFQWTVQDFEGVNLPGSSRANVVWRLGYNIAANGARVSTSEPAVADEWESFFTAGGIQVVERHIAVIDTSGVLRRVLSFLVPRAGGAGSTGSIACDTFNFTKLDGTQKLKVDGVNDVLDFLNALKIRGWTNNVALVQQRNAADSAFLKLPFIDNTDYIVFEAPAFVSASIGSRGALLFMTTANAANSNKLLDLYFSNTVTGTIASKIEGPASSGHELICYNTHTTSGNAHASLIARSLTGGGDANSVYDTIGAANSWAVGSDRSDSAAFKISRHIGLGTNDALRVDPNVFDIKLPAKVPSYTVAGVPSAATAGAGAMIYVSNEAGGAVIAFSDATNWRRVTDRAVVS